MIDKQYFMDQYKVLVVIPDSLRHTIPKNRTTMHYEGIEGACSIITDVDKGERYRYHMCGTEYRGLVIAPGAEISRGALEYLMSRMRNPHEDKGVPWVFNLGEDNIAALEDIVENRLEELLQSKDDYWRELSLRKLFHHYRDIVGLKMENCEYTPQPQEVLMGDVKIKEFPHSGFVLLEQGSRHKDQIAVRAAEIPELIKHLQSMYKLQGHV